MDFEEGVGAPDGVGWDVREGFGEGLELRLEAICEGDGFGVSEEVDGVHYEVLAPSPAFFDCSSWGIGRVVEI